MVLKRVIQIHDTERERVPLLDAVFSRRIKTPDGPVRFRRIYSYDDDEKRHTTCIVNFTYKNRRYTLHRRAPITKLGAARVALRFARDVVAGRIVATER